MAESLPPTRCRCAQTQRRDHKNQQKSAPSVALHYHAAASPPQSYQRLTGGAHAPTVEDQFSSEPSSLGRISTKNDGPVRCLCAITTLFSYWSIPLRVAVSDIRSEERR